MSYRKVISRLFMWIALAIAFNLGIFFIEGQQKALEFLGGYVIEQSLSLDNLFLFLLIFEGFGIKPIYQKRVLSFGIFGAIILRLIFVVLGVTIVNKFHWILYVFGVILVISGFKMMFKGEEEHNFKESKFLKIFEKFIPVTHKLHGEKFLVRIDRVLYATPLLAILVLIESSDILFAIDSIPAIFSITTDPFIVYTSNIFAILGLRNMYFLLEKVHHTFEYVKYGVAVILIFTGVKLAILFFHIEIPLLVSLAVIFTILLVSVLVSALINKIREAKKATRQLQ